MRHQAADNGPLRAEHEASADWKCGFMEFRSNGKETRDQLRGLSGDATTEGYQETPPFDYSAAEKQFLMALAKQALQEVVTQGQLPQVAAGDVPPKLAEPKGCFVTLTKRGKLRGCIGLIMPEEPLFQAVLHNTRGAARRDPRFAPVEAGELPELEIEISILTEPKLLTFRSPEELLEQLRPHETGVVLRLGEYRATFLPQVWQQLPDKVDFLNRLAVKAGCAASDWRTPAAQISIYRVQSFKDSEL